MSFPDPAGGRALVTGAARGIGRAIAERLARDGRQVVATDIDAPAIAAAAERWDAAGLTIEAIELDICDRTAAASLLASGAPYALLVNNAGIGSELTSLVQLEAPEIARVLRVNLHGTFIMAQEAARRMVEGASIVNIASRGYLGGAGAAHYVASKAGVVGLTRAMAIELRWRGIRVNAVAPGMVDTRMIEGFTAEMRQRLEALEPAGSAHQPEMIADCVAFLGSPAARGITGQVVLADAGKSLGVAPF